MPVSAKKPAAKVSGGRPKKSAAAKILPSVTRPGDEYDSRRQFFQMISKQIGSPVKEKSPEFDLNSRSFNLYRRMVKRFLILTVILVVVVLYFTAVKLTIVVHPGKELVSDSLIVDVYTAGAAMGDSGRSLSGQITPIQVSGQADFPATGEKAENSSLQGEVVIYNNTAKSQALVATTRLLAPDNKLFRIKSAVVVPAQGKVVAAVYADRPGADMAIAPTRFTIPGLRADLQSQIYAESQTAFSYRANVQKYISAADIDQAATAINLALLNQVKDKNGPADGYDQAAYDPNPTALKTELVGVKVGEQRETFTLKGENTINVVSFAQKDIVALVREQLTKNLPTGKSIAEIDPTKLNYTLSDYNAASGVVSIKVDFSSQLTAAQSEIIDRHKLVNLSQGQVTDYLRGVKEVDGFELYFTPAFIKRSPLLVDRINVLSQ